MVTGCLWQDAIKAETVSSAGLRGVNVLGWWTGHIGPPKVPAREVQLEEPQPSPGLTCWWVLTCLLPFMASWFCGAEEPLAGFSKGRRHVWGWWTELYTETGRILNCDTPPPPDCLLASLLTRPSISWLMDLSTSGTHWDWHLFNACMPNNTLDTQHVRLSGRVGSLYV